MLLTRSIAVCNMAGKQRDHGALRCISQVYVSVCIYVYFYTLDAEIQKAHMHITMHLHCIWSYSTVKDLQYFIILVITGRLMLILSNSI